MKRFTETLKWSDPWFRRLSSAGKLLWVYAVDHCDNIGLVEIDLDFTSRDIGLKVTEATISELGDRIENIGGGKYFLPKFIKFQYGQLSPGCPAHKKVIQAVSDHCLLQDSLGYHYPNSRVTVTLQERNKIGKEEERRRIVPDKTRASLEEIRDFCREHGLFPRDAESAFYKWESNGWTVNGKPIKCWKSTLRNWKAQNIHPSQKQITEEDFWPEHYGEPESDPEDDLPSLEKLRAKRAESEQVTPEQVAEETQNLLF